MLFKKDLFLTAKGNWFSAFTVINGYREENQEENTITTWVHIAYGSLQVEDKENIKYYWEGKTLTFTRNISGRWKKDDELFLYSIGNDVRSCEKKSIFQEMLLEYLKYKWRSIFKGKRRMEKLSMLYAPISDNKDSLPESPLM